MCLQKKVCETLWIICFERNKTSTGLLVSMPGAMQAKAQDPMDITRVKGVPHMFHGQSNTHEVSSLTGYIHQVVLCFVSCG